MKKKVIIGLFASMFILLGSMNCFAGQSYQIYNTTVGSFSAGYTGYQTKSISGANGGLWSTWVSPDRAVYARMQKNDGTEAPATRALADQSSYSLPGYYTFEKETTFE